MTAPTHPKALPLMDKGRKYLQEVHDCGNVPTTPAVILDHLTWVIDMGLYYAPITHCPWCGAPCKDLLPHLTGEEKQAIQDAIDVAALAALTRERTQ
jgi:hypothetical protein